MTQDLLDGFRLEDCEVEPALGVLDGPGGSNIVGPESMEILVYLARQQGKTVSRRELVEKVWSDEPRSDGSFDTCLTELNGALQQITAGAALIKEVPGQGWRLVGKVHPLYAESNGFSLKSFWKQLRARDVIRVSIAYWAVVWATLQSADFLFDLVPGIPEWALNFLIVTSVVCFPIVIVFAWIFRWTPDGLKLDDADAKPDTGHRLELIVAAAAAIALGLFFIGSRDSPPGNIVGDEPTSIAVLRFVNIGGDPDNSVYSDGISDEMLNLFANIEELRVPARESSWSLFDKGLDATAIADRLNVEYFVEGSVRKNGDQIRVMIQLIDATGNHIWSKPFERNRNAILDLPSSIAAEVVDELRVVLPIESASRLRKLSTEDNDAYIFYLQARDYLRRPQQAGNIALAKSLFDRALIADHRFALAYAGLCDTHLATFLRVRSQEEFQAAEAACHRASTLDAELVETRVALGNLYRHTGQFDKAEDEFRRAIELQPRLEVAHYGLARSLQGQGRLEEAERVLLYCVELEPAYWGPYSALGGFYHGQGRYADAIQPYERVTELTPENPDAYTNLGAAYYEVGSWDEAETAYQRSIELAPTVFAYQNLGTLYYFLERFDQALAMHDEAVHLAPESYRAWGKLAAAARYVDGKESVTAAAYDRAIELAEADLMVDSGRAETWAYLATYYVNVGNFEAAASAIERALKMQPESPEIHYLSAIVRVRTGNNDESLAALEMAVDKGYSLRLINSDPQFEILRGTNRFKGLVGRQENQHDQPT